MSNPKRTSDAGFSLVELLTVVLIIGVLAALSIPNIMTWIRTSKIRAASQEVSAELQAARLKAISRNVNFGVVFLVLSDNTYRYVIEDDLNPQVAKSPAFNTMTLAQKAAVADQAGPVKTLPDGVVFLAGDDSGVRFTRIGATCDPDAADPNCPALGTGWNGVDQDPSTPGAAAVITLSQASTGMTRTLRVASGGRVFVVQ